MCKYDYTFRSYKFNYVYHDCILDLRYMWNEEHTMTQYDFKFLNSPGIFSRCGTTAKF